MRRVSLIVSLLAAVSASGHASPPPSLDARTARALARGDVRLLEFGWHVSPPGQPGARPLLAADVSVGTTGNGSRPRLFQVGTCAELYRQIRSHGQPRRLGSKEYSVRIGFGLIRAGDQVLLDDASAWCHEGTAELEEIPSSLQDMEAPSGEDALPEGLVCAGERCSTDYSSRSYKLLSLVGPLLSLEENRSAAQGGGPPYHGQSWRSFDLRSGKQAHPLDLVEEKSLERALRADPVVRERLGPMLESLGGAREILEKLLREDELQGFAFHAYDRKQKRVALRIAFHPDMAGMAPNEISQLGLWVTPRAEARRFFEQAAAGEGFFLSTRGVERRLLGAP